MPYHVASLLPPPPTTTITTISTIILTTSTAKTPPLFQSLSPSPQKQDNNKNHRYRHHYCHHHKYHGINQNRFPQDQTYNNNNNSNNNNNNNRIQRCYSRFFTISSQRHELSPTCMLKWPRRNRVQITCNTSSAYHVQHVVLRATWYEGAARLLSLTELKWHLF